MTASDAGGSPATAMYDRIGVGYQQVGRPAPPLAEMIRNAMAGAHTVVDLGAGAGSCKLTDYELTDADVTAVAPARVTFAPRPGRRKVLADAEELPFELNRKSVEYGHRLLPAESGETLRRIGA
ncbi:hypothetical protein [Streptomyces sp. NBC_00893]|uniref:hypothetical protein n=1 Tax=Streptomyces sp. NBC_00893 TaxID=2975862 RepID=UPI0022535DC4|nr:hypothetical protein [Streptomyces sp. NBC_00893]MCX4849442.1 hypothetical protein [Streptomyces sp. NBC_00893]